MQKGIRFFILNICSVFLFFNTTASFAELKPEQVTILTARVFGSDTPEEIRAMQQTVLKYAEDIFETKDLANQKDPIIVQFFDYNCGYCKQMAKRLSNLSIENPNLKLVYKEFPIRGNQSRFAARAAVASKEQGQYTNFHRSLMYFSGLTDHAVIEQAEKLKLNIPKLKQDMASKQTFQEISDNYALGKTLKITGTPSYIIYGKDADQAPHIYYIQGAIDKHDLERYLFGKLG